MHSSRKYTHISSYGHKISAVALTLALAACPGKEAETGTDTDDMTGNTTTDSGDATSASPTTGEETGPATTAGTGSATDGSGTAGMTDPVTTGAPDDTTTTGMTSETGDPETGGAGPVEECMAACSKIASCDPMRPVEDCTQACATEYAGSPACTTAGGDLATCIAGLDCEQIALLEDEDPMLCGQQFLAVDEACSGLDCGFINGAGPGQCSLSYQCDGPLEAYECEKDICTCSVDGVAGASCPAMQFCRAEIESQQQMAAECCGFDW